MSEKKEPVFKCPNDLKINITKSNGEVIIDEECCTAVSVILKNSGELATSFFGAHNPEMVKVIEKATKMYFKAIKKALRKDFKETDPNDIKVLNQDLKESDKWKGQEVPDLAQEKENTSTNNNHSKKLKSSNKSQNLKESKPTNKKTKDKK